jgi:hypothetical protein
MNRRPEHPDWCAADHTCTANRSLGGEHRAEPHTLRVPGAGSAVLTRVQTEATDRQHAEITLSITLPGDDHNARLRLAALLTHLRLLITEPIPTAWDNTTQLPPARRRAAPVTANGYAH